MSESHVAGRYAKALFLLAERVAAKGGQPLLGLLERTLEELEGVAVLLGHGTPAWEFLENPQVNPADKHRALAKAFENRTLRSVAVFTDLLLRKKRLRFLGDIARDFRALVEQAQGLEEAHLVSAVAMTRDEIARLHAELERTTRKKIVLSETVDPSLVGGAYVRIGDRIIDRSVRTLLEAISHQLYDVSV